MIIEDIRIQEEKIAKIRKRSYKLSSDLQKEEKELELLYSQFVIEKQLFQSVNWTLSRFECTIYGDIEFSLNGQLVDSDNQLYHSDDIEFEKAIRLSILSGIQYVSLQLSTTYDSRINFIDFQNFIKKYDLKIVGHDLDKEFQKIEERYNQIQEVKNMIREIHK